MSDDINLMVECLKTNHEEFKSKVGDFLEMNSVVDFINQCNDSEKDLATTLCSKVRIFLVHKIFEKVELIESIQFLEIYYEDYKQKKIVVDLEGRTWLHIAVMFNRSIEILQFLIAILKVKVDAQDLYHFTPLHFACQKDKCSKQEISMLMKEQNQLISPSLDGSTALELLCQNEENIRCINEIDLERLLKKVDKVYKGTMMVESKYVNKNIQKHQLWLNILRKNDKYYLILHIQKDDNFEEKCYLERDDMISIIRNCTENGHGILTFVKKTYFGQANENISFKRILKYLTGTKIKDHNEEYTFYKSSLFLCLMTGRFELLQVLLQYTQFEIVPYALCICLICKRLSLNSVFSIQIVDEIFKLKDFCELYAIEVMNRTSNKDLSLGKSVITRYLCNKSEKLDNKCLLGIAYNGNCKLFLSLPVCQQSLDNMWKYGNIRSPVLKFYMHSASHIVFLIIFSHVLLAKFYERITVIEILCYLYGFGYFLEEIRQIHLYIKNNNFSKYCKRAENFIDLLAIVFMILGYLVRIFVKTPTIHANETNTLFKEGKEINLFVSRLFLCISLILFYMKVLHFLSIFEVFGPKLKMIGKMIFKDLLPLLLFFSIFIISFGVAFQSLLYPNMNYTTGLSGPKGLDKKTYFSTTVDIFRRATFTVFDASYTLDEIENDQLSNITDFKGRLSVYVLLLVFIVVVNVMLMNLLIALFSYTVTVIVQESKVSWKSNRYSIIGEYKGRTMVPPPFNVFGIIIDIISSIKKTNISKYRRNYSLKPNKMVPNKKLNDDSSISYYILQSLAVSNCRYKLIINYKDKEYETENRLKEMEKVLSDIYKNTCIKKSLTQQ